VTAHAKFLCTSFLGDNGFFNNTTGYLFGFFLIGIVSSSSGAAYYFREEIDFIK